MKIHLHNMVFFGYHGVHPEERKLGQRFVVNVTCESDPANDGQIKHLEDAIDYTRVFDAIQHIMEKKQYHVMEECANTIIEALLTEFPKITHVKVGIKKPFVPMSAVLDSVEIVMERSRL
ncbi:MAG: dihydroneopterin aldolase [Candidatus Cloacimonetes bacterium]|nr:dihydroneopterin aldolase [Candidatus Cloacimonadota bacterium]